MGEGEAMSDTVILAGARTPIGNTSFAVEAVEQGQPPCAVAVARETPCWFKFDCYKPGMT